MLEAVTLKRKNVIMRFLQVCSCERGKQEGTGGGKVCDEVCVRVCWGGGGGRSSNTLFAHALSGHVPGAAGANPRAPRPDSNQADAKPQVSTG